MLVLICAQKTMQIDLNPPQGERRTFFEPKNKFWNFSIFELRKISEIFQIWGQNLEFLNSFY